MSKKTLVVVESPSKAKTINKYLGKDYIVEASVGHVKDLIKFGLGVDVRKNFQPRYEIIRGKSDIIKMLKSKAEHSGNVLIATDPDREGEAIAWHIAEEIKGKNTKIKRILFNEITEAGIKKGLSEPRDIDEHLFMSQQARRVMDRLIGFKVSPFLSKAMLSKTSKALSAGRVQSIALRLICERENEIQNFVPITYWTIFGNFQAEKKKPFNAKLISIEGKNIKNPEGSGKAPTPEEQPALDKKIAQLFYIRTEEQADELIKKIKLEKYSINDITKKTVKRYPSAPFTTSSLQQEASKRLGFSNKKTMSLAQQLYEGVKIGQGDEVGLITYMRTDSVRLSPEAVESAREYINSTFGKDYLPASSPKYATKSGNVQDAHEAIRPTSINNTPATIGKHLSRDLARLYELIYNRFLASQMNPALIDQTTVFITGGRFVFKATGSVVKFNGFLVLYEEINEVQESGKEEDKEENAILPSSLQKGQSIDLLNLEKNKSQTKPRPRYTESSLVKELDELGIGRPSTYATIVTTITDRKYVELEKKVFLPTELGMDVNSVLVKSFPDLFNVTFTAEMENELDTVAEGTKTYIEVLNDFYQPFDKSLNAAEGNAQTSDIECDVCGAPMIIKVSRKGRFLGCSKYPECTNTKPLPSDGKKEKISPTIAEGITCDLCGSPMFLRESRYGKFYGCTNYPKCKGIKKIESDVPTVKCPKCNEGELRERFSPKSKKKFWGCSNYPKCDYLTNYEPVKQSCPSCGNYYIEYHFRKKDGDWEKFLKCPSCSVNIE